MIDTEGFKEIETVAKQVEDKVKTDKWQEATNYWAYTQTIVLEKTYNVDFYNILTKRRYLSSYHLVPQNVLTLDGGIQLLNIEDIINIIIIIIF